MNVGASVNSKIKIIPVLQLQSTNDLIPGLCLFAGNILPEYQETL